MDDQVVAEMVSVLREQGFRETTVADFIAKCAGLPPMLELYANIDGVPYFVVDMVVMEPETEPPYAQLICSAFPLKMEHETEEEQRARKEKQRGDLAQNMEKT